MQTAINPGTSSIERAARYLTVILAGETYGLAVLKIREIIRMQRVTPVPHMPAHVEGVINLRGRIIPILDLRTRLGLPTHTTDSTCIVVVRVNAPELRTVDVGLIVDSVEEVVTIEQVDIEAPPQITGGGCSSILLGMAKMRGRVTTLLEIDRVVAADGIALSTVLA